MRSTEDITHIINTLNYIRLLPKDEEVIELNKIIYHIKKINKDKRFSINYRKLLDKAEYLLNQTVKRNWLYYDTLYL